MIYLWPQSSPIDDLNEHFGVMTTPNHRTVAGGILAGRKFAVDHASYSTGKFDLAKYKNFLETLADYKKQCLFVTVPDVWADWLETWQLFDRLANEFRPGWPIAYALQDWQPIEKIPPADFYFVGGSDGWRRSGHFRQLIRILVERGELIHVGRINSIINILKYYKLGVYSVDGTFPARAPDQAKNRLSPILRWVNGQTTFEF